MSLDLEEIKRQAEKELKEEKYREAVNKYKEKLKERKFIDKIFPWKIVIIRKEKV